MRRLTHCRRSPVVVCRGGGAGITGGYAKTNGFIVHGNGNGGGGGGGGVGGRPYGRNCISGGFLFGLLTMFLLIFATQSAVVEAKRGCANFGHSCYGGMGKRANAGLTEEYTGEEDMNVVDKEEEEENPALVFTGPRSEFRPGPVQRHRFLVQPQRTQASQRQEQWRSNVDMLEVLQNGDSFSNHREKMPPYLRQLLRLYNLQNNLQKQRDDPNEK